MTLSQSIEKKLCAIINHTNVLQLLFHSEVYNAHSLNQACLNFVDTNAELVLAGNTILALPKEHLKFILSRDTFLVDEIQIFRAVQRWKEHNRLRPEEMADVLQCVRLSEIPSEDLISVVLPSGLYSSDSVCFSAEVQHAHSIAMSSRGKRGKQSMAVIYQGLCVFATSFVTLGEGDGGRGEEGSGSGKGRREGRGEEGGGGWDREVNESISYQSFPQWKSCLLPIGV